jgi:transposase
MEEVADEPLYRDRVCGIKIGKAGIVATIRVPSDKDPARRVAETRSFGTTKKEVLADWRGACRCPRWGAGGDCWNGPMVRSLICSFFGALAGSASQAAGRVLRRS